MIPKTRFIVASNCKDILLHLRGCSHDLQLCFFFHSWRHGNTEWLHLKMDFVYVEIENSFLLELFSTTLLFALIRHLLVVNNSNVNIQTTFESKCLGAAWYFTLKWPLLLMNTLFMLLETCSQTKLLSTFRFWADVRFFSVVNISDVSLEVTL